MFKFDFGFSDKLDTKTENRKRTKRLIEEYVNLAIFHGTANNYDPAEVKKINTAANGMLKISYTVNELSGTPEFSKPLKHPNPSVRSWAAFNLMEMMNPNEITIEQALSVIQILANSDCLDAYGAKFWLRKYEKSKI